MSEASGMLMLEVPVLQVPDPLALVVTRLTTQVLVAGLLAFGIGRGAPKRHPVIAPLGPAAGTPGWRPPPKGRSGSHCRRAPPACPGPPPAGALTGRKLPAVGCKLGSWV